MWNFKTTNTRCRWNTRETKILLGIMKEHNVIELLNGKTRRNNNVYVFLANELAKKGFNKNSDQVKLKFRTLKNDFLKKSHDSSKSDAEHKNYFQELEELLADRTMELDSTVQDVLDISVDGTREECEDTEGAAFEDKEEATFEDKEEATFEDTPDTQEVTFEDTEDPIFDVADESNSAESVSTESQQTAKKMFERKATNTRCHWSTKETKYLLSLMKEYKVMDLLNGKTRRNNGVYVHLSNELMKKGYNKTREQVKLKFRTLKDTFLKTQHSNSKTNVGRKTMKHYKDLKELLCDSAVLCRESEDEQEKTFDVADDSSLSDSESSESLEKAPKETENSYEKTLNEKAADLKRSHQSMLTMIREENESFLAEQRRIHTDYLKDMKEIMEEDRRETREMLLDISFVNFLKRD